MWSRSSARFAALAGPGTGLRRVGELHFHGPVELDLARPDLRAQLEQYAAFEEAGGEPYVFHDKRTNDQLDARGALFWFESSGACPLVRWTVQHYVREEV